MGIVMVILAVGVILCVGAERERAILSGWVPACVMLGSMLAVAAPRLNPVPPAIWAAALIGVGMLAGRGRDKLMSVHRGLSCVGMAALLILHGQHLVSVPPAASVQHHQHDTTPLLLMTTIAICLGIVALTIPLIVRQLRRDDKRTIRSTAQIGEAATMTTAVLWMSIV